MSFFIYTAEQSDIKGLILPETPDIKTRSIYMENLEILKGIVSDETYAALEVETKDSKIRLGDLSTDKYVSADKYKDLEKQLGKVNSALTEKTTEYDTLKEKAGDNDFLIYVPN